MAHLRGLRSESLLGLNYEEGVRQYSDFAISLMKKKAFPPRLIEMMSDRYATTSAIIHQRELAEKYALDAFELNATNLICMIYSPFTQGGKYLNIYLEQQQINCLSRNIHLTLINSDDSIDETGLLLERLSGLSLKHLRQCYRSNLVPSLLESQDVKDPMSLILRHDPHKAVIQVKNSTSQEIISGR